MKKLFLLPALVMFLAPAALVHAESEVNSDVAVVSESKYQVNFHDNYSGSKRFSFSLDHQGMKYEVIDSRNRVLGTGVSGAMGWSYIDLDRPLQYDEIITVKADNTEVGEYRVPLGYLKIRVHHVGYEAKYTMVDGQRHMERSNERELVPTKTIEMQNVGTYFNVQPMGFSNYKFKSMPLEQITSGYSWSNGVDGQVHDIYFYYEKVQVQDLAKVIIIPVDEQGREIGKRERLTVARYTELDYDVPVIDGYTPKKSHLDTFIYGTSGIRVIYTKNK